MIIVSWWKSAEVAQGYVDESDAFKNSTAQQISKNINLSTIEKMPNLAVDSEQKNDANPDFQQSRAEEKKSKAEQKSKKNYHFHNCTFYLAFYFKKPQ